MREETKELFDYLERTLQDKFAGKYIDVEYFVNEACIKCSEAFYKDAAEYSNNPFVFFASSSFGISEYPTYSPEPRLKNLTMLNQMSALYADKVNIKCPFEVYIAEESYSEEMWLYIIPEITSILMLKPLAEMGILGMYFEYFMLADSLKKRVLDLENHLQEKFKLVREYHIDTLMRNSEVRLGKFASGEVWIQVKGDPDYIFEGDMYLHGRFPKDLVRHAKTGSLVKVSGNLKHKIIEKHVSELINNSYFAQYYQALFGCSFLSNVKPEISDFTMGNSENLETAIVRNLPHSLPFLKNITPYQMIEFREYEQEAFERYRNKIKLMISENTNIEDCDIDVYIQDNIGKEIDEIDKAVKLYKAKAKSELQNEIVSDLIFTVAGCVIGGIDVKTATIASAFKAPELIRNTVEKTRAYFSLPETEKIKPYYFLWRLANVYDK